MIHRKLFDGSSIKLEISWHEPVNAFHMREICHAGFPEYLQAATGVTDTIMSGPVPHPVCEA